MPASALQGIPTEAFPTPPSSASTPPGIMAEDQQPPRKRARYNAPTSDYSGDNVSRGDDDAGRNTEATAVRIPRIRIKMSESHQPIISTRRLGDTNGEEDEVVEMESDDVTMTPATQEPSDAAEEGLRWEDQEVREMVDPEESWRVIGLSNVGNTCFTNAILQVFSSALVVGPTLMIDKRRFWKNTSFDGMNTFHRL